MYKSLLILITMVAGLKSCHEYINPSITISDLHCEYVKNPIGIDAQKPRFGWHAQSSEPDKRQTAYQILVASSLDQLNRHKTDILDTKKVLSGCQSGIILTDLSLQSAKYYFWKVRVWDENDQVSEYSEPAFFVTGLMVNNDWKASWITSETVFDWNRYYLHLDKHLQQREKISYTPELIFTKSFSMPYKAERATLFISGLGFYTAKINENEITNTGLNPAFTDYTKSVLYNSYDIKELLDTGNNTITIGLGNGYYNEEAIVDWGYDKAHWRGRPRFICQMHFAFDNGTDTMIVSDTSWDVLQSNMIRNSTYGGEIHDYSIDYTQHDKSNIRNKAIRASAPTGRLVSQVMPLEGVTRTFHPKSIKRIDANTQVVDAGINLSGRVAIKFNQQYGDTVIVRYGEMIDSSGYLDLSNIKRKTLDPIQTDLVIFSDSGEITWHPSYIYHGFQYVEIIGYKGDLTVDDMEVHFIHTDLERTGMFFCSNDLINKIQDATVQSYLSNYHGFPTDCPHREKNGWTADGHLAANTGLYNFNMNNSFEKWLHDINDAMLDDGRLPGIVPTSGWGYQIYHNITDPMGPAWDAALHLIPWYSFVYHGDIRMLENHYEAMKMNLNYYRQRSPDHIVRFGLADWSPYQTETNWEITSTIYFGVIARTMAKIAGVLGHKADEVEFNQLHQDIKKAFNDSIFNNPQKNYNTRTQTTLAGKVYAGFVAEEEGLEIINTLERIIIDSGYHLDCGMLGNEFILKALSEYDRLETVYNVINNTEKPGWGYWIEQGATTLWESWVEGRNDSRNHVIFAQVSEWFYKHILGIQPDINNPGFKNTIIAPYFPDDMNRASGYITTTYGKVSVKWEKTDNQIQIKLGIPFNSEAEFILPKNTSILQDGNDLSQYTEAGPTKKFISLGSGNHVFVLATHHNNESVYTKN